jgi:DNA-directed RNA polymerase specialized sigma24 family protein
MKAPLLVDALLTRDPGAPAALYDTHGESLFRYCWFILRNRDAAQVALRDTLVLAEAHMRELRDPDMLRPWLYALARGECERRQLAPGTAHDAVVARPDQPDADRRLIAWHAVLSLEPAEREALELTLRHGMDTGLTALVMGLPPAELEQILDRSRIHLEHALAGEILARHGVHNCPERVAALQGWAGELTVPLRERLVQHAMSCQVCGRYLPRNVSATKVYSLLPVPVPPQALRLRVMTCFTDPELVGYRMFVAARVTGFGAVGFPGGEDTAAAPARRTARAWSGPAAAAVAVAVLAAAVFMISKLGGFSTPVQGVSSASGTHSLAASPTVSLQQPGSGPAGTPPGHRARSTGASAPAESVRTGKGRSPIPLFLRATTGPVPSQKPAPGPTSRSPSPGSTGTGTGTGTGTPTPVGQLQATPADLSLGTGSTGQITLTANGGPVSWTASPSSGISLSSSGGTLAAGQQAVVTVTVSRSQQPSGSGTVSFTPDGGQVTVSWSSPASSSPPPPPTSSPAPTVVPPIPTPTSPSRLPTPSTPPTNSSAPAPVPPPASTVPAPAPTPTPTPAPTQTPSQTPTATPDATSANN